MRAVVRRGHDLVYDQVPEITPSQGQTLVRTLACGICGSDLHSLHGMEHSHDLALRAGLTPAHDPSKDVIFGHQFCAEILDHGPGGGSKLKPGTRVVSLPVAFGPAGVETIGFSNRFPGGFAEQMLLTEQLLLEVPNGLSDAHAAMTEPFAVGEHAVAAAAQENAAYLIIGCGPVGLSVIAALKVRGLGPIIASDFSAPRRRAAERLGADYIIDPALSSPHSRWTDAGVSAGFADISVMQTAGRQSKRAVIFECVGAPGLLQQLLEQAPPMSQIVVVGVCQSNDKFEPGLAIMKQLDFRFVLGYDATEFEACLRNIAEGLIPIDGLITHETGLSGVAAAFDALRSPSDEVQVMVYPNRTE